MTLWPWPGLCAGPAGHTSQTKNKKNNTTGGAIDQAASPAASPLPRHWYQLSSSESHPVKSHRQYEGRCAVPIRHIISTSEGVLCEQSISLVRILEDVQYERGTSSVQARMCITSQSHLQYKRGCVVQIRHILSKSQDVQYKQGRSRFWYRVALFKNASQWMNHYSY